MPVPPRADAPLAIIDRRDGDRADRVQRSLQSVLAAADSQVDGSVDRRATDGQHQGAAVVLREAEPASSRIM